MTGYRILDTGYWIRNTNKINRMIKKIFKNDPSITLGRILVLTIMTGSAMALNWMGAFPLNFVRAVWAGLAFFLFSTLLRLGHIKLIHWGWDYGQMILNVAWIFLFLRISGGAENPFSLLFFLAIIAAANARLIKGAIFTATISSLAYAGILALEFQTFRKAALISEQINFISAFSADFLFRGYIYAICFYLVAAFAGLLAERLQAKGRQLEAADQAWEELRLSTGDILEKMGSGLLTLNVQGQIKFCNRAGAQILGLDPARMTGAGYQSLLDGGLSSLAAVLQQSLSGDPGKIVRNEVLLTLRNGREIPLGVSANAIRYGDGRLQGIIAILQDLTEAKKIETRLQEMERLENIQELVQSLLQVVQPTIEQINKEATALMIVSPDHNRAAEIIKQKAEAIKKTLADFIRFARIENPDDQPNPGEPSAQEGVIIGQSNNFLDILKLVRQVAPSQSTVLILGESGTGKELVARELHQLSARSAGSFVSINCAALPETLLESELFGHVKGSFTGAFRDKPGLFQAAEGGTFFLDEVSETSPAIQVKLLRVLQEREVVPVGGSRPVKVDVRLISATNVDLYKAVEDGKFRRDLFYRLNVIQLELPPLRQRGQDILMLAEYFLNKYCRRQGRSAKALSPEAREFLLGYRWPGNVRELENAMERAVVLSQGPSIEKDHLPPDLFKNPARSLPEDKAHRLPETSASGSLKDEEKQIIRNVLQSCNGNKTQAARKLGIHYATLYRKLKLYGIK
ncbi:sigma 54-interacting transcriptional regulator [candidate division TA06 bacterium]|uniref:Sigma 54-interacting transcriptional regulator n=1 Tax=candidate division TA06 bacterium TaxID=2250710 RepID=A0A933I8M5_UNCT6|nr:sigma 54-interacting transcriptional regulator [candidate division TA06 bacterium]